MRIFLIVAFYWRKDSSNEGKMSIIQLSSMCDYSKGFNFKITVIIVNCPFLTFTSIITFIFTDEDVPIMHIIWMIWIINQNALDKCSTLIFFMPLPSFSFSSSLLFRTIESLEFISNSQKSAGNGT